MNYVDICSGISAPTVAMKPHGWKALCYAEIERFPSAVLKHHYPETENVGDFTQIGGTDYAADALVGGTPCQDFSVAGLRAGLDGKRGQLTIEYARLAARLRPRWLLWENVPGVLSADGGRAFGLFLWLLGQCGYGFAYRVFDAQYAGVPQRRRRVFLVGHLGDHRRAAAVLFDRESMQGYPAPRREAGKNAAPTLSARTKGGGGLGTDFDCDGGLITLSSGQANAEIAHDPCPTLNCLHEAPIVTHSLRADGLDASEDGTGRGTPLVSVAHRKDVLDGSAYEADASSILRTLRREAGTQTVAEWGSRILDSLQSPEVLRAWMHGASLRLASDSFRRWVDDRSLSREEGVAARAMREVWENGPDGRSPQGRGLAKQLGQQLGKTLPKLSLENASEWAVRRITPREAERLQGFPDDYTLIPDRGRMAADGPRYKALGNSMAVPEIRWIGQRVAMVDQLEYLPGMKLACLRCEGWGLYGGQQCFTCDGKGRTA